MIPLHPKVVHFPVALLISVALFGILAVIVKNKRNVFQKVLFWNFLLGMAGAIAAIVTGLYEEQRILHNEEIHALMGTHKTLGLISSGIFLLLLIWIFFRKSKMKYSELAVFVLLLVFAAGLTGYQAHLGGRMVYEHGAGVVPMEPVLQEQDHKHGH